MQAYWGKSENVIVPGMAAHVRHPCGGRWRLEDQEVKALLGYTESSRPAWDSRNPFSKKQNPHVWKNCYQNDSQAWINSHADRYSSFRR